MKRLSQEEYYNALEKFVSDGNSLYIYSHNCGNGKMRDDVIRQREEIAMQIRLAKERGEKIAFILPVGPMGMYKWAVFFLKELDQFIRYLSVMVHLANVILSICGM